MIEDITSLQSKIKNVCIAVKSLKDFIFNTKQRNIPLMIDCVIY